MGGPSISWKGGRTDYVDDSKLPPRGRLPDAAQDADHIRWIFTRMGFNDQEIVTLSGAHNLRCCHSDPLGFENAWANSSARFSNQYFQLPLSLQWEKTTLKNGIVQFMNYDEDTETELMMLPTDISLVMDPGFRKHLELYAKDKDRFFKDFSKVFDKLMELGIVRDVSAAVTNTDNAKGGYHSSPNMKNSLGLPEQGCEKVR